jgi:hypothetical protein
VGLTFRTRSPMLWLFYVWASQQGQLHNAGLVRTIFNNAVECGRSKCCAMVWFYFVMWEIEQKEYLTAKALVYRGIKECPWSKGLLVV